MLEKLYIGPPTLAKIFLKNEINIKDDKPHKKKDKLKSKSKTNKNPATLFITNLILPGTYNFLILIRNMEKIT